MKAITSTSRVTLRSDLHAVDVDDAIFISDSTLSDCYGLESIARRIWQLLRFPATVKEVCAVLTAEYDVDCELCETEVLEFLNDSAREGLIRIAE